MSKDLELNHTPPVWTATDDNYIQGAHNDVCIVLPRPLGTTAVERAANIRLICAAPEMLNACFLAFKTLSDGFAPEAALSAVSFAIERATGQTPIFEDGMIRTKGEEQSK